MKGSSLSLPSRPILPLLQISQGKVISLSKSDDLIAHHANCTLPFPAQGACLESEPRSSAEKRKLHEGRFCGSERRRARLRWRNQSRRIGAQRGGGTQQQKRGDRTTNDEREGVKAVHRNLRKSHGLEKNSEGVAGEWARATPKQERERERERDPPSRLRRRDLRPSLPRRAPRGEPRSSARALSRGRGGIPARCASAGEWNGRWGGGSAAAKDLLSLTRFAFSSRCFLFVSLRTCKRIRQRLAARVQPERISSTGR